MVNLKRTETNTLYSSHMQNLCKKKMNLTLIKKVKNMLMLQINHHSKLTCICISHWIRLTKRHVSECRCNYFSHLYVRFGHSGRFGQRICSERSQLSADESCWAFQEPTHMLPFHTSYLSISHTAVVLCVCGVMAWESVKGGWQSGRKETRERQKGERRKEQLCKCDWTTLPFHELQW